MSSPIVLSPIVLSPIVRGHVEGNHVYAKPCKHRRPVASARAQLDDLPATSNHIEGLERGDGEGEDLLKRAAHVFEEELPQQGETRVPVGPSASAQKMRRGFDLLSSNAIMLAASRRVANSTSSAASSGVGSSFSA